MFQRIRTRLYKFEIIRKTRLCAFNIGLYYSIIPITLLGGMLIICRKMLLNLKFTATPSSRDAD